MDSPNVKKHDLFSRCIILRHAIVHDVVHDPSIEKTLAAQRHTATPSHLDFFRAREKIEDDTPSRKA